MSSYLNKVNRTKVTTELLRQVLEMHAAMPAKDRAVFEARAARLFELLDRKRLGKNRGALAVAIDCRIMALARLQSGNALKGWSLPGEEPGMDYIYADLVEAAAEEPLIEDAQGQVTFDAESFRKRVLLNAQMRGRA